jgi:hypothetical protein
LGLFFSDKIGSTAILFSHFIFSNALRDHISKLITSLSKCKTRSCEICKLLRKTERSDQLEALVGEQGAQPRERGQGLVAPRYSQRMAELASCVVASCRGFDPVLEGIISSWRWML